MRFVFVHTEKASFPIARLCRVVGVSRQGYYSFAKRGLGKRALDNEQLKQEVAESFTRSRETYGSPRILRDLQAQGRRVSKRRVEETMKALGISPRPRKSFRRTTVADPAHPKAENVLNRNFTASRPDEVWVSDITYIHTAAGWCYLAAIIDLCTRAVVGWAVDVDISTTLPLKALDMALQHRRPEGALLHHSDLGCQYTSAEYRQALKDAGIDVSMSRKGNCWDNAVAESFFATLKTELIYRSNWRDDTHVQTAVFEYIEVFYNRQRLHSTLGYKTPAQVQNEFNQAKAA
jgi:transposase InsO family protein